jgi:hypothetical protein
MGPELERSREMYSSYGDADICVFFVFLFFDMALEHVLRTEPGSVLAKQKLEPIR